MKNLLCLFILSALSFVELKFYGFYASFEGCLIGQSCKYKTDIAKQKAFARGVGNPCSNEPYDNDFMICEEFYFACGYLPLQGKETVSATSGVTIGIGVDLSEQSEDRLYKIGISNSTITKLRPFLNRKVKGKTALDLLLKLNLSLSNNEATDLSNKVKMYYYNELAYQYDQSKKCDRCTDKFADLHASIRTALFSLYYNTGKIAYADLWPQILNNQWADVAANIESFKANPNRRKMEGLLIRSTLNQCNKLQYTSFVIDESGSIDSTSFSLAKSFVVDFIRSSKESNYIGVLTYDSYPRDISNFSLNKTEIINALNSHSQGQGGTATGSAISRSRDLFKSSIPFDNYSGVLKVMIVMTDGQSGDSVVFPANNAREAGIQIVAIGIGNGINQNELIQIGGSTTNIMTIKDFSSLKCYMDSLESSVCTQAQTMSSNKTVVATSIDFNTPNYYEILKPKGKNEKISLKITEKGGIFDSYQVNMFVSYSTPFPDKNLNDMAHLGQNFDAEKTLIVGSNPNNATSLLQAASQAEELETLYLTVYGSHFNFSLSFSECDPSVCQVGTNDTQPFSLIFFSVIVLVAILTVYLFGKIFGAY